MTIAPATNATDQRAVPSDRSPLRRRAIVMVTAALVTIAILGTALLTGTGPKAPNFQPGQRMTFTASQQRQWEELTSTPDRRAQVLSALQKSFAGVARIGISGDPHQGHAAPAVTGTAISAANYSGGARTQQAVAVGMSDHLWATASYADVIGGGIWTAQQICGRYLPGWICSTLANVLRWLASGYTYWTGSHGVWGAAYWSGYVTGGRW